MSDEQVLAMPIRRFWLFSKAIDRMHAEADLRAIRVTLATQSPEKYKAIDADLHKQLGKVAQFDEVKKAFDHPERGAMLKLKGLGSLS